MRVKKVIIAVLALVMLTSVAFAAGTAAGTAISNYATGAYKDANGNAMASVQSNTVTTIVSQVAGVDITPSNATASMVLYGTVSFPLTLTNTGNGTDAFDLSRVVLVLPGAEFTAKIYYDADGNGAVNGSEAVVTETADLAADATYNLVVLVENIVGYDGATAPIILTGVSQFDGNVSDQSEMTATINTSVFTYTMTADDTDPQPGDVVTYTYSVSNTGSADAKDVNVGSNIAVNTSYVAGSMTVGGVAKSDAANDDAGTYTSGAPSSVNLLLGEIVSGASISGTFQVVVNLDVPVNTVVNNATVMLWKNILGEAQTSVIGNAAAATLTIAQIYFVAVGADQTDVGDPSDYVYYAVTVTNTGNGPDVMAITEVNTLIGTWEFYLDANQNGQIDGSEAQLTSAKTATMAQGAVVYLVAKGQIPAGTADETVSVMTLTATSVGNSSEVDDGKLTFTVTAPTLTLVKAVSPTGNQPPGTVLTYTVTILNVGTGQATALVISDDVPANTTYQAGTIKLGGVVKTDADDTDEAELDGNAVVITLPTLISGGSNTIEFKTKIN